MKVRYIPSIDIPGSVHRFGPECADHVDPKNTGVLHLGEAVSHVLCLDCGADWFVNGFAWDVTTENFPGGVKAA